MKKVLIITYYWIPSGGSGVQRWLKFVKYLPQFDWEPIVITVNENKASYPQIDKSLGKDISSNIKVSKTNTFEILNLYKRISPEKEIPFGGFTDDKKPTLFHKVSRFIRGNFFLPDPRRGWNRFAYKEACKLIEQEGIDSIVTTSPPHSTQLIGLKLKQKYKNINWIADFRDPWTDIHYYKKLYPTKLADIINKRYERKVLEQADKIIVTCKSTQNTFQLKSNKLDNTKFNVITNGFDEDDFLSVTQNKLVKFTITYIGILYNSTDLSSLLSAIETIDDKESCHLRFVGHSGKVISSEIQTRKLSQFTEILPQVKHAEAVQIMSDSSVLVLLIPNNDKDSAFLPGKLFEYLAAKRPILCIAPPNNEAGQIIERCNAGKVFDYNDKDGIFSYLIEMKKEWEKNNICNVNDDTYLKYSRKKLTEQLTQLLNQ